jgi:hypothetical protein
MAWSARFQYRGGCSAHLEPSTQSTSPSIHMRRFCLSELCLGRLARIHVNGQIVNITSRLRHALGQFRSDGLFCSRLLLWVDALCINQRDQEERATEVQRMKDIYRIAWTVDSWLGLASSHTESGFQLLRDMAAFRRAGLERDLKRQLARNPDFLGNT